MPVTATQAWTEAAASGSNEPMLLTLAFYHSSFGVPIYVVADTQDQTFVIEGTATFNPGEAVLFTAVPFTFEQPKIGEGGGAEWNISVDNIGREISKYLPSAVELNEAIQIWVRGYLPTRPLEVGWGPYKGEARNVRVTGASADMTVTVADPQNRRFARKVYDLVSYPALQAIS